MSAFVSTVITKVTIAVFFQRKRLMMIERYQFKVDNGTDCISCHREQVAGMHQTLSFVAPKQGKNIASAQVHFIILILALSFAVAFLMLDSCATTEKNSFVVPCLTTRQSLWSAVFYSFLRHL